MGFIKIYTEGWNELTINERAVYITIAGFSRNDVSYISRESISNFIGLKDFDVIGKCTATLEEKDWLKRDKKATNKGFAYFYKLVDRGNFTKMDKDFLADKWNANELALLASLFVLRVNNLVDMPNLYKNTGFAKTSYYRHIKALVDKGYITAPTKDDPLKIKKFIPIDLTADNKKFVEQVLSNPNESALYGQIKSVVESNFEGVGDPNKLINSFICGIGLKPYKKLIDERKQCTNILS